MKRVVTILCVICQAMLMAADKAPMPLYVVDGKVGVSSDSLPPNEDIASVTILPGYSAKEIYGERASNGVMVIVTKDFDPNDGKPVSSNHQTRAPKDFWHSRLYYCLLVVLLILIADFAYKQIIKMVPKIKKRLEKEGIITPKKYSPGSFDAEGVHFKATGYFLYYGEVVFGILCMVAFGAIAYSLSVRFELFKDDWIMIFALTFFVVVFIFLIILEVGMLSRHKCHLIIDEQGVRGVYVLPQVWALIPKFEELDFRWEQLASAEIVKSFLGRRTIDGLALFSKENPEVPLDIVNLQLFPTQEVIDAVNYFYARNKGLDESKQPVLIEPIALEDKRWLQWIIVLVPLLIVLMIVWYLK